MVAKMLLPTLGGTPMVWNTCVVFFQAALLCGYAFAHVLRRLATLRAAAILLFLAVVAGSRLPIDFPRPPQDLDHATTWLLLQLLPSLGPVFFVLAAAGPSVQTWFSRTGIAGSDNPAVPANADVTSVTTRFSSVIRSITSAHAPSRMGSSQAPCRNKRSRPE